MMSMHLPLHAEPGIRIMMKLGGIPAIRGSQVQPDQQPGMFWRMQLLCPDLPSGTDRADPKPRIHCCRRQKLMTQDPDFKGYIHDVGGPTANFRHPACEKQMTNGVCPDRQCLFPTALQKPECGSQRLYCTC